jgi:hypothetical protein
MVAAPVVGVRKGVAFLGPVEILGQSSFDVTLELRIVQDTGEGLA